MRKTGCVFTAAFAGALGLLADEGHAATAYPTRIQVTGREFGLVLSRLRLAAGPSIVQFVNRGEDDHDLRFRRVGGTYTYRVAVTRPGGYTNVNARFYRGTYRFWCSLPGHREAGMTASLSVYRPA
jgi:plastocyanin